MLDRAFATLALNPAHNFIPLSLLSYSRPCTASRKNHMSITTACRVSSLDHLVLTVQSLPKTVQFYTEVLGMNHSVFRSPGNPGQERHALSFGKQKINLHERGKEFEPKAQNVHSGSADLCFLTEEKIDDVAQRLKARNLDVLEGGGIVRRTGAQGQLRSCYCRDPDGNLIEFAPLPSLSTKRLIKVWRLTFIDRISNSG